MLTADEILEEATILAQCSDQWGAVLADLLENPKELEFIVSMGFDTAEQLAFFYENG